jgi:hypothetical protein
MNKILPILFLTLSLAGFAQTTQTDSITKANLIMDLQKDIEQITDYYKNQLKQEIAEVKRKLKKNELTPEEAEERKAELAQKSASSINYWVTKLKSDIAFVEANGYLPEQEDITLLRMPTGDLQIPDMRPYKKLRRNRPYLVTTSGFYLTFGNNLFAGDELGFEDVRFWESAMFGLGYSFLTKLDRTDPLLRFRYGAEITGYSTSFHGSQYFVTPDDKTIVRRFTDSYERIIFSQTQFIAPVHLEIGQYKREGTASRVRYDLSSGFTAGIGGYLGLNLMSQNRIERERNGRDITLITRNDFDNNIFLYGLDAYVGYGITKIFARLALNDVFKQGSVDGQYFSFGIRFID